MKVILELGGWPAERWKGNACEKLMSLLPTIVGHLMALTDLQKTQLECY